MRLGLKQQKGRIFFWERIAFRISIGFIVPILLSAYALFYVANVSGEISEFEERIQRMWNVIHVNENKALLSLTKTRMNVQAALASGDPQVLKQLQAEHKELQLDIEYSRRLAEQIANESQMRLDPQLAKLYSQFYEAREQLGIQIERFASAMRRNAPLEAAAVRKEIDASALNLEKVVGRMQATNELQEAKVTDVLKEGKSRTTRVLAFFLIAMLFLGAGAACFVTLSITAPIRRILMRVKDIATGDGDLGKRVYARTGGELKELAEWMNVFLEKNESIIATIANASSVVSETTEQVGSYASRTNVASAGISKNMMEQSMNLDECTSSMSKIDDLLQNSGESTRQAASLSKIAMDRALQGGASVHETIEAMEKIEESSRKIDILVSSINEIASQTNLLAINAAIEATKAGDHGKGFAVVAEEVRKLAERARKLTGEVTSLMTESGMRVKAGVGLAKGAGVSLDGIIKDVEAVSSLIQRIAAASSKQAESSSMVLEFMQKVSEAVRANLASMQDVTRATEQTTIGVQKLDSLVAQLNQIVGKFQVDESRVHSEEEGEENPTPLVAVEEEITSPAVPPPLPSIPPALPRVPDQGGSNEDAA